MEQVQSDQHKGEYITNYDVKLFKPLSPTDFEEGQAQPGGGFIPYQNALTIGHARAVA